HRDLRSLPTRRSSDLATVTDLTQKRCENTVTQTVCVCVCVLVCVYVCVCMYVRARQPRAMQFVCVWQTCFCKSPPQSQKSRFFLHFENMGVGWRSAWRRLFACTCHDAS